MFNLADARDILERGKSPAVRFRLERCAIDDRPRVSVTKTVVDAGVPRRVTREFAKLSLGQQQSVLLALVLCSKDAVPLIIDQPEDNLDSEFIYQSLVPALRAAKERRQVIVVTHNANIAVLGDAEQIFALKSVSDRARVVGSGSIDRTDVRALCCQILEGTEEAFRRRGTIYGVIA